MAFRSLYTNLPNAEAIHLIRILGWILNHLFRCWTLRYACKHARSRSYTNPPLSKKSRCLFFMLGIVDSARFTPRGALRLNHLFRSWTLRYKISQGVPSGRFPRNPRNNINCRDRNSKKRVCKIIYYFFFSKLMVFSST